MPFALFLGAQLSRHSRAAERNEQRDQ